HRANPGGAEEDRRAAGFHDALKPGGRLVLETQNVSRILLNPQPMHVVGERDGDVMIDRWELDAENARFLIPRLVMRGGRARAAAPRRRASRNPPVLPG